MTYIKSNWITVTKPDHHILRKASLESPSQVQEKLLNETSHFRFDLKMYKNPDYYAFQYYLFP